MDVSIFLIVLNVIGAIVYVMASSHAWAIPQEHGLVPITGEPFVWALAVAPVVATFLLLNLAWGSLIVVRRQWRAGRLWLAAATIWLVAVLVDFAPH